LVREARARKDASVWRRDEDAGQSFALKVTAARLEAIAVELAIEVDPGNVAEHQTAISRPTVAPGSRI
jgi:hypothetical protein